MLCITGLQTWSHAITYTISDAICMKNRYKGSFKNYVDQILHPHTPRVGKNGHFLYFLHFVMWPFSCTFYWPFTPSSCPHSYWMPPNVGEVSTVLDFFLVSGVSILLQIYFSSKDTYDSKQMKITINMIYVKCILRNY